MPRYKHAQPFDIVRTVQQVQKNSRATAISANANLPVPAVIDPSYVSGQPNAFINGSTALSGPYSVMSEYIPVANNTVIALPVPGAGNNTYIILGHYGPPSIGQPLADMTQYTATTATPTQASAIWSIPAADAVLPGATYEFWASGSGTWGSTQQALTFGLYIQGTQHIVTTIPATTFAINSIFHWMFWVRFYCVVTGSSATWYPEHRLLASGANQQTAWDITETLTTLYTQSSLASQTVELQASWASVTGAPTVTTVANWFRRAA